MNLVQQHTTSSELSTIPSCRVVQNGQKNINIEKVTNLDLNKNIIIIQSHDNRCSSSPVPVKPPNCKCYNLFVTRGEDFSRGYLIMPLDRCLPKDDMNTDLYNRLYSLSPEAIAEIKSYPAIFANENTNFYSKTAPEQNAYYGLVTNIEPLDNDIKIYFQILQDFPQHILNDLAEKLNLGCSAITHLNRKQWLIKEINLIKTFEEYGYHLYH